MEEHKTLSKMMRAAMQKAAEDVANDFVSRHNFDRVLMDFLESEKESILRTAKREAKAAMQRQVDAAVIKAQQDFASTTDHEVRCLIRQKMNETDMDERAKTLVQTAIDAMKRAARQSP